MFVSFWIPESVNVRGCASIQQSRWANIHFFRHKFSFVAGAMIYWLNSWLVRLIRGEARRRRNFAVIYEVCRDSRYAVERSVRSKSFRWRMFGFFGDVPFSKLAAIRSIRVERSRIPFPVGGQNGLGRRRPVRHVVRPVSRIAVHVTLGQRLVMRTARLWRTLIPRHVILAICGAVGHWLRFVDGVLRRTNGVKWLRRTMNEIVSVIRERVEGCLVGTVLLAICRQRSLIRMLHIFRLITGLVGHRISGLSRAIFRFHGIRWRASFAGVIDADCGDAFEGSVGAERLRRWMLCFIRDIPFPILGSVGGFSAEVSSRSSIFFGFE